MTSVVDEFNSADDATNVTLRDAIYWADANDKHEIWLPAWNFVLIVARGAHTTDASVEYGDLDIGVTLTFRGSSGLTNIGWSRHRPQDDVFELLGDYNFDGVVDNADAIIWAEQEEEMGPDLEADGDEDGEVDQADHDIYSGNFGNSIWTLFGVTIS